jgi:manganese/iron transport system permease protein
MSFLPDALTDPWSYEFMQRAFAVAVLAGVVCGVVGTFVVLRGMAFIGDAVAHSVFPGVAIGYALGANLALSGAVAGVTTAIAIAFLSQNRRLREDAIIGVLFALAFGIGIVVVSTQSTYTGDLASFLFGQILGISDGDVWTVAIVGGLIVLVTLLLHKELVTVSLDRETARAMGLPAFWLEALLYIMVTLAVVISLQAVGNILVLALLVTPAAAARLLTEKLTTMMIIAAFLGGASSLAGLYLSYHYELASGGLIVIILSCVFFISWLLAPRHGLLIRSRAGQRLARRQNALSAEPAPTDQRLLEDKP